MIDANRHDPVRGFTLVEVVVSLTVGGILVLLAHQMSVVVGDAGVEVSSTSVSADLEANADLLLASLLAQVEAGAEDEARFLGDTHTAAFTTWCDRPTGWQERCRVTLGFVETPRPALAAVTRPGGGIVLKQGFGTGAFRYLSSAADGGTWISEWGDRTGPPLALGVLLDADTLILPVRPRG